MYLFPFLQPRCNIIVFINLKLFISIIIQLIMLSPLRELLSSYNLVLASSSPQRKAILEQIGLEFSVIASNFDEDSIKKDASNPRNFVKCLAHKKALCVAEQLKKNDKKYLVIGADTVIVFKDEIIGKPHVPEVARETLQKLSGQTHSVCTGVSIVEVEPNDDFGVAIFCESTEVKFANLTNEMIQSYVNSGEPLNKAGAYGIQSLGALLVEKIDGDYTNVVGFPAHKFLVEATKFLSRLQHT